MSPRGLRPIIVAALLDPASLPGLTALEWDLLIRQGRRANLLSKLAFLIDERALLAAVPAGPAQHLLSAKILADRQRRSVLWEIECIRQALADAAVPTLLLKGAAYTAAGLPASRGRMFVDVDVLVPKHLIVDVERALTLHGWRTEELSAYDQHYYRKWMHELPPMRHTQRESSIDVHHTLLPETARVTVNTPALFEGAVTLPGRPDVQVLRPVDLVLHSAAHLFHEGELENGLRDLFDLDALLRDFSEHAGFWESLMSRAEALGLGRPLYYALRYTSAMLETPVPATTMAQVSRAFGPSRFTVALMDACYLRALQPVHASCDTKATAWGRWALYVRSHWLRMPLHLLSLHLLRKACLSFIPEKKEEMDALQDKAGQH